MKNLALFVPAPPPDVRQGYALPESVKNMSWGYAPGSAFGLKVFRAEPEPRAQPRSYSGSFPAGHSPASHRGGEAGANSAESVEQRSKRVSDEAGAKSAE